MKRVAAIAILAMCLTRATAGDFTEIVSGLNWPSSNFLSELSVSLEERSCATGTEVSNVVWLGMNAASKTWWNYFQVWITNNCDDYVDWPRMGHTASNGWKWFSPTSFFAAAGIPTQGWRRATTWDVTINDWTDTNDAMYAFGNVSGGDIIGPWLMDDLQKAFVVLTNTVNREVQNATNSPQVKYVQGPDGTNCTEGRTLHLANWATNNWTTPANSRPYQAFARKDSFERSFNSEREYAAQDTAIGCSDITNECDVYFRADPPVNQVFLDVDGLGMASNKWWKLETLAAAAGNRRVHSVPTAVTNAFATNSPVEAVNPLVCDGVNDWAQGVTVTNVAFLLKWDFTYDSQ